MAEKPSHMLRVSLSHVVDIGLIQWSSNLLTPLSLYGCVFERKPDVFITIFEEVRRNFLIPLFW
jgi:hypothetical protein